MTARTLVPALIIGAVLGLAIGYFPYKVAGHGDFIVWISYEPRDALTWLIGGIIVAGAAAFLKSKPPK